MPTYRLTIEYEGTRYRGWQEQKNARTVAGELKRAIEELVEEKVDFGGAGRTDAGVHALAQTAHLRTRRALQIDRVLYQLNERLPSDIHVLAARAVAERFHARHHAISRSYLYQISRRRTALGKRFVWWVKRDLDVEKLGAGAAAIAGRHDFAAFSENDAEKGSTEVVVERVEIATPGELVLVRIVASHFLWKMVRRLVGTLVEVALGEIPPEAIAALLAEGSFGDFHPAERTAPPSGLFLERVLYPSDPALGPLAAAIPVGSPS